MKKLLIVDDDLMFIKGISFYLAAKGYSVDVALNGKDALTKIKKHTYDMIITDLVMPDISGLTVTSKTKEWKDKVPVMMVSSTPTDEIKNMPKAAGADMYFQKPVNLRKLHLSLEEILS